MKNYRVSNFTRFLGQFERLKAPEGIFQELLKLFGDFTESPDRLFQAKNEFTHYLIE